MEDIRYARLADGRTLEYVFRENPPMGKMKVTYFSPDKTYVAQFYKDPAAGQDTELLGRLEAILGRYNPTLPEERGGAIGGTETTAAYFAQKFCWPAAIITYPALGLLSPAYPPRFFFTPQAAATPELAAEIAGKDKKSRWFTSQKLRQYLKRQELGDFRSMIHASVMLARSVRRLHQAGLAHSDLSCGNVLIDPPSGTSVIIDIDTLVVPGLFPPEVIGTAGYIAPEVLETMNLDFRDKGRRLPSALTDLHALAVLLYENLLLRHPLTGPKVYTPDPLRDEFLCMGPKALFIEHPEDRSNRPEDLDAAPQIKDLGPQLEGLFLRSFVDGLHRPDDRPTALEWEMALAKTWDLLHPCPNPDCTAGWFVLHDTARPVCPFCGAEVRREDLCRLRLKKQARGRPGQWMDAGLLDVYDGRRLFRWHSFAGRYPDEKTDRQVMAEISRRDGRWFLTNAGLRGMVSPDGHVIPAGRSVELRPGAVIRTCGGENACLIEVV